MDIPEKETLPLSAAEKQMFQEILPSTFGMFCRNHVKPILCGLWQRADVRNADGLTCEFQPVSSKTGLVLSIRTTAQATESGLAQKSRPRLTVPGCAKCRGYDKYLYAQLVADFYTLTGPQLEGRDIHHRDDNPMNCSLDNLVVLTVKQNRSLQDRAKKRKTYHVRQVAIAKLWLWLWLWSKHFFTLCSTSLRRRCKQHLLFHDIDALLHLLHFFWYEAPAPIGERRGVAYLQALERLRKRQATQKETAVASSSSSSKDLPKSD